MADGEAGGLSVVGRRKADCTSCSTRGAVCDIFTILAVTRRAGKDPVRQTTLSFSLTHVSVLRLSPETSSQPRAQPTTQVSPAVEFVQSSASNFSFWAMVLSVKVAYLSGRCCCPPLGLVALCASGRAFFLPSETVAIVTCTCWWDGGETTLW